MINTPDLTSQLAIDSQQIEKLRQHARQNPEAGLQQAAKQFEALFVSMMLKSMRDASPEKGLFDSEQSKFYTQMLDQQLAQNLAGKGIGLADLIVQQLTQSIDTDTQTDTPIGEADAMLGRLANQQVTPLVELTPGKPQDLPARLWANPHVAMAKPSFSGITPTQPAEPLVEIKAERMAALEPLLRQPREFVAELLPHARRVAQETGIPERFMIAQAALETGWGKHQLRDANNMPSFNLFGIKAGSSWRGKVVEATTTEYIDGKPQKLREQFRAYASFEEAFRDYASLLQNHSRYAPVVKSRSATAFAWGLQQAGYATDPRYAEKLINIINSDVFDFKETAKQGG